ncbi:MAG: hypothetical protein NC084_12185 [Bacteroides sp.]|nr:hypothetical protein [Eubacterium sp.]MCM1419522.1 hypothetical protein [Roseburia sp.]MCM1463452.1 hypothetical protein [Bacteroides sp.]
MQKIRYTTSLGTIEIDDENTSSLTGEKILRLNDFDGNSGKTRLETMQCIGLPGQKVLSSVLDVKTVTAKIAFAPIYLRKNRPTCTGAKGMYALRREILKRFPLGEDGTLEYTNDSGVYTISARIDQTPIVTVHDGWLCDCTVMFTCDYPYWCRAVTSEKQTVSAGGSALFVPPSYGDVASPIGGILTCTETLSDPRDGIYYQIRNTDSTLRRVHFCRPISSGRSYQFNFLYNNEWVVPGDVYFAEYCEPCVSVPVRSSFRFDLLSAAGSLDVQLIYYNLYLAV